MPKKE